MIRVSQRAIPTPPGRVYPHVVHSHGKFGDKFGRLPPKFVDKRLVGAMAGP
jgi:hypothetical protein